MPQKYSIHIGLNAVDPFNYTGKYPALRNAENDTRFYQSIAEQKGFATTMLIGKGATSDNLLTAIKTIAGKMNPGDLFFLSYSGHGTRVKDLNGDEPSGYDQVLVLYDRLFIDDEFQNCWILFPEQSKVFFVNDSCYNGTVSRFLLENRSFVKSTLPGHVFRGIDASESNPDFQKHIAFYSSIKLPPENEVVRCPIIHIAACQDNQLADDGNQAMNNGFFTSTFRDIFDNGQFQGSYRSFFNAILPKMPPYQTPVWDVAAGADTSEFERIALLEC